MICGRAFYEEWIFFLFVNSFVVYLFFSSSYIMYQCTNIPCIYLKLRAITKLLLLIFLPEVLQISRPVDIHSFPYFVVDLVQKLSRMRRCKFYFYWGFLEKNPFVVSICIKYLCANHTFSIKRSNCCC